MWEQRVLFGPVDTDIDLSACLLEHDDSRYFSRPLSTALLDIAVMRFASLPVAEAKPRRCKASKPILPRQFHERPMPRWRNLPSRRARFFNSPVHGVLARGQLKATFPAEELLSPLGLHQ